jgi:TonB family protein
LRRVRQVSTEPTAASFNRLAAALLLSGSLHIVLICGVVLPADSVVRTQWNVIHARLQPSPAANAVALKFSRPAPARAAIPTDSVKATALAIPAPAGEPAHQERPAVPIEDIARDATLPLSSIESEPSSSPVPDLVHYAAKDLDIYPLAITPIAPAYPSDTPEAQGAGSVTLLVLIDDGGRVVGSSVVDATAGTMFEQAALQALARTAFHPAQKEGRTVRSQILIKVEFDPAGANAAR